MFSQPLSADTLDGPPAACKEHASQLTLRSPYCKCAETGKPAKMRLQRPIPRPASVRPASGFL